MSRNSSNTTIKRLMTEARALLRDPDPMFVAAPVNDDLFLWHFTIKGTPDSVFEGGIYHGKIVFPNNYPLSPPDIMFMTPSGRFETNKKLCLTFTTYHPEQWNPGWDVRTALTSLIAFMPTKAEGAIGGIDLEDSQRKQLTIESRTWKCKDCDLFLEPDPLPQDKPKKEEEEKKEKTEEEEKEKEEEKAIEEEEEKIEEGKIEEEIEHQVNKEEENEPEDAEEAEEEKKEEKEEIKKRDPIAEIRALQQMQMNDKTEEEDIKEENETITNSEEEQKPEKIKIPSPEEEEKEEKIFSDPINPEIEKGTENISNEAEIVNQEVELPEVPLTKKKFLHFIDAELIGLFIAICCLIIISNRDLFKKWPQMELDLI